MDVLAAIVVVATFYFIVRGTEVRLALAAGKPAAWFASFAASMVRAGLLTVILPASARSRRRR